MKHIKRFLTFKYKEGDTIVNEESLSLNQINAFHKLKDKNPLYFNKGFYLIYKEGVEHTFFTVKDEMLPKHLIKSIVAILSDMD